MSKEIERKVNNVKATIMEEVPAVLPKVVAFYGHERGPWKCFSNFYPCEFIVDGIKYNCTEQYMMRQKALCFHRHDLVEKIMSETDPIIMKRYCRKDSLPEFKGWLWDAVKYEKVLVGVLAKFEQNQELKERLLATGDSLICEASPRDKEWGIGMGYKNPLNQDPKNWRGNNLLGKMLMEVREIIRNEVK